MTLWIDRLALESRVHAALARSSAVALIGPRQAGKTTLARRSLPEASARYFDLESPRDLQRLDEPLTAPEGLQGLVVIDEIQRRPDPFSIWKQASSSCTEGGRDTGLEGRGIHGMTPEKLARQDIDRLLTAAGWRVCDVNDANIHFAFHKPERLLG